MRPTGNGVVFKLTPSGTETVLYSFTGGQRREYSRSRPDCRQQRQSLWHDIRPATNTVVKTIPVGTIPVGVAVTPDGTQVYVANNGSNNISVIARPGNTVVATVAVGTNPFGVGIMP